MSFSVSLHDEFESIFRILIASLGRPVRWKLKTSKFLRLLVTDAYPMSLKLIVSSSLKLSC